MEAVHGPGVGHHEVEHLRRGHGYVGTQRAVPDDVAVGGGVGGVSHFFFFIDTPTPEIYTLSLHDALPILDAGHDGRAICDWQTTVRSRNGTGRCAFL